jgi:hypothetical protein
MGIDIYAQWRGQSEADRRRQEAACLSVLAGSTGYLREAYHGEPYATKFLCAEAFETGRATIIAAVLRERLPKALEMVEIRQRNIYHETRAEIEEVKQSFRDFIALCEAKEQETGEPVRIIASY